MPEASAVAEAERALEAVPFPLVVDFGTSSTLACTARAAHDMAPRMYPDDGPEPSMLLFESVKDPDNPQVTIGQNARARAYAYPHAAVPSVKKLLGRPEPCRVTAIDGTVAELMPDRLARLFLEQFLDDAILHFGWWPARIVCTWPRTFSPPQVEQLRSLAEEAVAALATRYGLAAPPVETAYDEANAAALYCLVAMLDELAQRAPDPAAALRLLDERRIVAFDVGGGTTDYVSIAVKLEAAGKNGASRPLPVVRTRVEGLSGDFDFGGDMITNAVIFLIKQTIEGQFGARVPTAAGGAAAEPVWRDNFFALFRIAESVKVRMSKGAPRVLLRDVLSELPGPLRAVSGDEPAVEEYDAARLSSALADVALTREAVDALVRPTIEQHVAGLARLCSTRPADVLVLAGNGVQYPLYGELFAAHRASILSPQGRILQPDGGGKLAVATGAYRTIINNLDGFRVAELKAASASPVACGDYYFLTTTGRMAQVPGLRQPFIRVGEPLDEVAGVVYDSGQERPPVRIPIGAFVVGRRLQGAPEGSAPVPIQLFYPAAEVPERPNGSEPRRAEPGRASRWAEVQQILDDAWVELKAAIDALAAAQTAQEASRVAALAQAWRRRPALDQPNEAVRLAECQHWLQVMLESYTAIRHVKQQRRLRYRKVRLRPELAERLRRCVDLLERISAEGVDEPPRPVPAGDPRAVFYRVQLMPDLSVTASFRGDHFEIPALSTGTPAQFYASASVFDMGTRPFER